MWLAVVTILLLVVLTEAKYLVIIDCGSTGSRVYVFSFDPGAVLSTIHETAHKRIKPGLSSFVKDENGLRDHVQSLVRYAKQHVPVELVESTSISLKATAGLRELPQHQQEMLIVASSNVLSSSGFYYNPADTHVLSGQHEALFGLLGIMPAFQLNFKDHVFAVADMGSSSKQIAFIHAIQNADTSISQQDLSSIQEIERICKPDFVLTIPDYGSISILARSLKKMGLIAAMEYVDSIGFNGSLGTSMYETECSGGTNGDGEVCIAQTRVNRHNCLSPAQQSNSNSEDADYIPISNELSSFHGSGSFVDCVEDIRKALLPQMHKMLDFHCLQSSIPHTVIGIDNFPKVLEMLGFGSESMSVTPHEIQERGVTICETPWEDLLHSFPGYMPFRAQRACFGAAYIFVLLTDLYGIELDSIGASHFRAINSVEKQELGWAAGAAVYAALELNITSWKTTGLDTEDAKYMHSSIKFSSDLDDPNSALLDLSSWIGDADVELATESES